MHSKSVLKNFKLHRKFLAPERRIFGNSFLPEHTRVTILPCLIVGGRGGRGVSNSWWYGILFKFHRLGMVALDHSLILIN